MKNNGNNGKKKLFLGIKFHEDYRNREIIEKISEYSNASDMECVVTARDFENWGERRYPQRKLMRMVFSEIDKSDALILEFSEKGVGMAIEAGYAFSKGIPVFVIAKENSDISTTFEGVTHGIYFYKDVSELPRLIKKIKEQID